MQFGSRVDFGGDYTVVVVEGDIDMAAAPGLRSLMQRTIADGNPSLIVDLTECSLIDSAGLGILLGGLRRARAAGGTLELVVPFDHLRRTFEICDLDRVFTLHASSDQAAHAIASTAERIA